MNTFEGIPCKRCQSTTRYIKQGERCVACQRAYYLHHKEKYYTRQKMYRKNPQVKSLMSNYAKKYGATIPGACSKLWSKAKARAKNKNLPFSITPKIIQDLYQKNHGKCNITGVMLHLESINEGNGHRHPFTPSLDQVVAGRGYTSDNIQLVAFAYNMLKSTLSDEVAKKCLVQMAAGIYEESEESPPF